MPQCCFAGCHNRTDDGRGLSFFRFPRRDLARTAAWVVACGRKDFSPSQHSRVCSRHFSAIDFDRDARHDSHGGVHRRLRLKDTAVPTTNPIDNPWQNTDNMASRKSQKSVNTTTTNTTAIKPNGVAEVPAPGNSDSVESSASLKDNFEKTKFPCWSDIRPFSTVLKEFPEEQIPMCTPAKRPKTVADALDLSHKTTMDLPKSSSDVIVLSEDEDEKVTPSSSDTEKENAPCGNNGTDVKSLLISLENDLRQEEATLLLLQKLRESQNSNSSSSSRPVSKATINSSQSSSSLNSNVSTSNQKPTSSQTSSQRLPSAAQATKTLPPAIHQPGSPISAPKVTKQAALQSLEQLYATKKAGLRKQLERNLEKVSLPRPTTGTGFCEIAFIPSTLTTEFTSLLGLEEVVKSIQDYDPSGNGKSSETRCSFSPFSCVKCGTDFTPVWKREKPGSTHVVCEACLTATQRLTLKKEYEEAVQKVLQLHVSAEREVEREYQDIVTNSTKLDVYIKEQEKKLLATQQAHQLQLAQQQAAYSQRYNNKSSVSTTASGLRQSPSTVVGGTSVAAAAHQRSRVAASVVSGAANVAGSATVSNSSAQATAQAAAVAQIALQQYAKAMSGASTTSAASPTATDTLMMAAMANTQQQQQAVAAAALQQQQQQQQRLAAAQLLSGLQAHQQQTVAVASAPTTTDHTANALSQIQALLMSNVLISGASGAQNANSRAQLFQQAVQYLVLQHQQQQAQQQAAAQAAAAHAAQQNAVLTHLLSQIQSNPSAYFNLMQLWAASGLGGAAGSGGSVPGKKYTTLLQFPRSRVPLSTRKQVRKVAALARTLHCIYISSISVHTNTLIHIYTHAKFEICFFSSLPSSHTCFADFTTTCVRTFVGLLLFTLFYPFFPHH
ncbi:gata zinc finger domain containing 2b [Echinococcus multilocularis]|uniref:Gata zinc finger domain containing 2b n=1 Tax=Echinococcus multilocularis TaxID=6211 RepID=A0A068YBX5_ECHMU|nr:gata zinc finger domain containing 2b [Echinococcus multilocularis]